MLAAKLKKSARDRRYYQRHRNRILARKRAKYEADGTATRAAVARYKLQIKSFNVSPVAT